MARFLRDNATLFALIVLGVLLTLESETFFTPRNLNNIALQVTTTGIIAVGMTMVILIAGIDLAVGSVVGLAAIVVTWLMQKGLGVWPAVGLTIGGGGAIGLWNGFWIARFSSSFSCESFSCADCRATMVFVCSTSSA